MVNAQQWLAANYPQAKRSEIKELDVSNRDLEGHLDLRDFANLKVLDCSANKLTSLDLSNCQNLQKISCHDNQLPSTDFLKKLPNPTNLTFLNLEFPLTDQESINRAIKTEVSWKSLKELAFLLKNNEMSHNAFLSVLRLLEAELALTKTKKITQPEEEDQEYTLFEASEENEVEIIQKLIESGIDIDSTDEQGNTALHYSVMKGQFEATQKLLELGARVDIKNEDGETPLHLVADLAQDHGEEVIIKIVQVLLEKGSNPNVQDELGNTALHYAAQNGNLSLLKVLVEHKGNLNATNNFNWSVLHSAASAIVTGIENWEIVEWLLKTGADVTVKSTLGSSVYDVFREKDQVSAEHYKALIVKVPEYKK